MNLGGGTGVKLGKAANETWPWVLGFWWAMSPDRGVHSSSVSAA